MTFEFELYMPEKKGISGTLEVETGTAMQVAASIAININDKHPEYHDADFVVITVRRKPNDTAHTQKERVRRSENTENK